ncbi:hypothetical protein ACFQ4K_20425 [Tistrella bauzanensis]
MLPPPEPIGAVSYWRDHAALHRHPQPEQQRGGGLEPDGGGRGGVIGQTGNAPPPQQMDQQRIADRQRHQQQLQAKTRMGDQRPGIGREHHPARDRHQHQPRRGDRDQTCGQGCRGRTAHQPDEPQIQQADAAKPHHQPQQMHQIGQG